MTATATAAAACMRQYPYIILLSEKESHYVDQKILRI